MSQTLLNKELPLAGLGRRTAGGILDLIFILLLMMIVGFITGNSQIVHHNGRNYLAFNLIGWSFVTGLLLCFLLFFVMEYYTGKTPGKYLVKTRVVSENWEKISFWQSLLRNLGRIIDFLGVYLVGFLIVLFDKKNQRFGDLIAKTYVVVDKKP